MAKTKTLVSLPDGTEHPLRLDKEGDRFHVRLETAHDTEPTASAVVTPSGAGPDAFTVMVDGRCYEALVDRDEAEISVQIGAERYRFRTAAPTGPGGARSRGGRQDLKAPMPGKVVKLLVAPGDEVTAGQGVVLFEAMKMQNEIRAPGDGIVEDIPVREGDAVEAKTRLMVLDLK